jgi:hypothetical protein
MPSERAVVIKRGDIRADLNPWRPPQFTGGKLRLAIPSNLREWPIDD